MNNKEIKNAIRKLSLSMESLDSQRWTPIHLREGLSPVFLCSALIQNLREIEKYNLNYVFSDLSHNICQDCLEQLEFLWNKVKD